MARSAAGCIAWAHRPLRGGAAGWPTNNVALVLVQRRWEGYAAVPFAKNCRANAWRWSAISLLAWSLVVSACARRSKCPAMVDTDRMEYEDATDTALLRLMHHGVSVRASSRSVAARYAQSLLCLARALRRLRTRSPNCALNRSSRSRAVLLRRRRPHECPFGPPESVESIAVIPVLRHVLKEVHAKQTMLHHEDTRLSRSTSAPRMNKAVARKRPAVFPAR
jgi:hypothetical protein